MESCCCFDKRPFRRERCGTLEEEEEFVVLSEAAVVTGFDESERPKDCFQTYHADKEMKTATHGPDEGRLDLQKSVLISRRQKFCESATARPYTMAM